MGDDLAFRVDLASVLRSKESIINTVADGFPLLRKVSRRDTNHFALATPGAGIDDIDPQMPSYRPYIIESENERRVT